MKTRTNILLLSVLLFLCVAYWLTTKKEIDDKQKVAESKHLFSFTGADIASITIQREGEHPTSGQRVDEAHWNISSPEGVAANSQVWERVATNIAELSNERTIEDKPKDPAIYGLKEPRLKVNAKTKDGKEVVLAFGEMEPTQKLRYGQVDDGKVFLVSPDQFFLLDRDLLWLRDRDVFRKNDKGITHIEFTPIRESKAPAAEGQKPAVEEAVTVIAEKGDNGTWRVLSPQEGEADQQMLTNLATNLQFAVGRDYVDKPENLKDYRLDPPKARISVKFAGDSELQSLYLGSFETAKKEEPGVFVMKDGGKSVFVIDAELVRQLPLSGPDAWREKSIVTRQGSDIASIKYQAGPQTFLLAREESGWKIKEPVEIDTDQAAVSAFIGKLLQIKGTESYQQRIPEFGLDVPAIRITLTYKDAGKPSELLVGAEVPNQKRHFMTQDSGTVVTVSNEEVQSLAVTQKDFMTRKLMAFKVSEAREVELTADDIKYVFVMGEKNWKVQEPAGKVWESQDDMQSILDVFRGLNAESVDIEKAPEDLSFFGLDKPAMAIKVTTQAADGASTVQGPIYVGKVCADNDKQRFARIEGRTQIYRIRQSQVSAVRQALRGVAAQ